MASNDIVSASFGVYIRQATHSARRPRMATWVLVYALWAVAPDQTAERRLVHRRRIYLDERDTGRWHHFSFLAQVRRWVANPQNNQGLFVQATDSRGEPLAVIQPNSNEEQPYVRELCILCSKRLSSEMHHHQTIFQCFIRNVIKTTLTRPSKTKTTSSKPKAKTTRYKHINANVIKTKRKHLVCAYATP